MDLRDVGIFVEGSGDVRRAGLGLKVARLDEFRSAFGDHDGPCVGWPRVIRRITEASTTRNPRRLQGMDEHLVRQHSKINSGPPHSPNQQPNARIVVAETSI